MGQGTLHFPEFLLLVNYSYISMRNGLLQQKNMTQARIKLNSGMAFCSSQAFTLRTDFRGSLVHVCNTSLEKNLEKVSIINNRSVRVK